MLPKNMINDSMCMVNSASVRHCEGKLHIFGVLIRFWSQTSRIFRITITHFKLKWIHFPDVISFTIEYNVWDLCISLGPYWRASLNVRMVFLLFINDLIRFVARKKISFTNRTTAFKQWTRHEYNIINCIRHMINGHFMVLWMTQKWRKSLTIETIGSPTLWRLTSQSSWEFNGGQL